MQPTLLNNSDQKLATKTVFIFNTHIPYVLEDEGIFNEQENWIFEAITETYVPLFNILSKLKNYKNDNVKIVLSFTPCTIKQMLEGKERYFNYLDVLKKLLTSEIERSENLEEYNKYQKYWQNLSEEDLFNLNRNARFYYDRISNCEKFFQNNDLLKFINDFENIELWTSCPNHNFLPLYKEKTIEHFIRKGIEEFEKKFNRPPDGFWLPECGFIPGIEKIFMETGIKSTSLNINSIGLFTGAEKSGLYDYEDLQVMVHDDRICRHLWKATKNTIPSNPLYREFYRDLGFDIKPEYLSLFGIPQNEQRVSRGVWTGIKYHAISAPETNLGDKNIYNIEAAKAQAKFDAKKIF